MQRLSSRREIGSGTAEREAKYEIAKDAGEEDIREICGQIAADLMALLQRNPAAVAQAQ